MSSDSQPAYRTRDARNGKGEMGHAPGYESLDAFRVADELATDIFRFAKRLEEHDRWLRSQIVRAAVSAPANIAEGYGRASNREFLQHLTIAHGSLFEVDYYLRFMQNVELATADEVSGRRVLARRASRLVYGLMKKVKSDTQSAESNRRYIREEREVYGDDEPL